MRRFHVLPTFLLIANFATLLRADIMIPDADLGTITPLDAVDADWTYFGIGIGIETASGRQHIGSGLRTRPLYENW